MSKKVMKELVSIQSELKAPKNQFNKFGNYAYRNAEDILEALKPLLKKYDCTLTLSDEIVQVGDRYYVKALALLRHGEESEYVEAYARETEDKKGMDGSQITGAASSYARKYALNGLFLIDDTKDADANENHTESQSKAQNGFEKELSQNIDKDKAKIMIGLAKSGGYAGDDKEIAVKLCKEFGVEKLTQITVQQYSKFAKEMEKLKDKSEGKQETLEV